MNILQSKNASPTSISKLRWMVTTLLMAIAPWQLGPPSVHAMEVDDRGDQEISRIQGELARVERLLATLQSHDLRPYVLDDQARILDGMEQDLRRTKRSLERLLDSARVAQNSQKSKAPRTFAIHRCGRDAIFVAHISRHDRDSVLESAVAEATQTCINAGFFNCEVTRGTSYDRPLPFRGSKLTLITPDMLRGGVYYHEPPRSNYAYLCASVTVRGSDE